MHASPKELVEDLRKTVVGRGREIELVVAALTAGRHVLLEGPPGTGKSTLLRALSDANEVGFELVEGNAELTPARLIGHFDPARVLADGYDPDVFVDGPLTAALKNGSLLYIEELNRVPEETLNVLVTVMSEREITVPRLGTVIAEPSFRLVAAMNPFDSVGTARISAAVYDRLCRLIFDYQSAADERGITAGTTDSGVIDEAVVNAVDLVRRTRAHPDVRIGSSVRGAIDLRALITSLAEVRGHPEDAEDVTLDASLVALSSRIKVREGSDRTAEDVITELWRDVFGSTSELEMADAADTGKATAPKGAVKS